MDGTLTPPREKIEVSLIPVLEELSDIAEIGILTGSDYNCLKQQVGLLLDHSKIRKKLHLLPCNGTKHYYPPSNNYEEHKLISSRDMIVELGRRPFQHLMLLLIQQQANFSNERFPLTGHFIDSFTPSLREGLLGRLQHYIKLKRIDNLTIKLGGDTSFDIFPTGWDKTYSLQHFPDYTYWFIGDRCEENGNDKEIYDLLQQNERSFKTNNTGQTKEITSIIINKINGQRI